ncbi:MAG TPA: 2-succinyl-5-enolpyruvyl-6-hydroxy-3-cyclohexene-1-carboxylic-acid synthase [Acidimicrobiales bacterium]|jgi:2-succinyl-5-enolpyruvyl-6-hydroxy-3-cyclohexene-1-carboxylate synthase|nr:2-succinyl-5-enolpyruvyl-6-hydroxy-3-cyclohexene-1-carboxylic-acid synthase [Acidimicrobiales bacterium]
MTGADAQAAFASTLVDEWVRAGATDAVVAPGSRSTPMLVALAGDGRIRLHVVIDERSAGFVALGLGAASGRPALVVTTSGTAAVELHPAVVEAHQGGVPLLAITADRPPELHHVGAPQTVEQDGLYGSATRFSAAPGVAELAAAGSWRSLAARAWAAAAAGPPAPGPVHLNLAFREPLLATDEEAARALIPAGRCGCRPWHDSSPAMAAPAPDAVVARLAGAERGLIVAGHGSGDPAAVADLATVTGWPVLAEPRSGCRVPRPGVIAAADALLRCEAVAGWRPDLVLRLGRPWASKVVGSWLAALDPGIPQILVDPHGGWADPDRRVGQVVAADPGATCRAVAAARGDAGRGVGAGALGSGLGAGASHWRDQWRRAESLAQDAIESTLGDLGSRLTEPGIARLVTGVLPDATTLVTSSSMPVRDVEWFAAPRTGLRVLANRGANGIDGVVSTVVGTALATASPVVGLVGDLAFIYDAGALLGAASRGIDCTLVVVDNDGGGIFSFLPQATVVAPDCFERLWGTPHRLDLVAVAAAYGAPATVVDDLDALSVALTARGGGLGVVLARTDRGANVAVHERLNAAVAEALRRGLAV